jgi:hypothetical protein
MQQATDKAKKERRRETKPTQKAERQTTAQLSQSLCTLKMFADSARAKRTFESDPSKVN